MKFFVTHAFLAVLTLGVESSATRRITIGTDDTSTDRDETEQFWRSVIEDFDSMATKAPIISSKPSAKPSAESSPAPVINPVTPSSDSPSDSPILATSAPTTGEPSSTSVPPSSSSCRSIETLICTIPEFSTLCDLVLAAGLGDALNEDIFTVFAPTNEAFDLVPQELVNELTTNSDMLRNVLLYHAVPEVEIRSEDLVCGAEMMMANINATTTTCIDDEIYQVGTGNLPDALPKIVASDGVACNGIVHVVDQVILSDSYPIDPTLAPMTPIVAPTSAPVDTPMTSAPSEKCQSIYEVVCTLPEFEILCALVGETDLIEVFSGEDAFTLFAPINTGFELLSLEVIDAVAGDLDLLKSILLSHAVSGEVLSSDLVCAEKVTMVNGDKTTTVCTDDGKIYQVGAGNTPDKYPEVVAPDGVACNGIIHAIDRVIL